MGAQYEDDEDEFDTDDTPTEAGNETGLVKDLRKQLRAANKKAADLETRVSEQEKGLRERTVKETLTAKGVRPGVAKFIPDSVTDEAGVLAWLDENAEDLGIQVASDEGSDQEPDPELDQARRVQALGQRSSTPTAFQNAIKELADPSVDFESAFNKAKQSLL